jgi:hypothetical protein
MLFMVVERFEHNDMIPVYRRFRESGRQLPEGLKYVSSWIEVGFSRCFQLMETDDLRTLQEWVLGWRGTGVTFEVIPVLPSKEVQELVAPHLAAAPSAA